MKVQHKKNPARTRLKDKYTKYLLQRIFCRKLRSTFFSPMNRFFIVISLLFIASCSKSDRNDGCNFLANNAIVDASINLNLPQYSQLQFTGNTVYIQNEGIAGVYLSNVGNSSFRAFDAADPAHAATSCSMLNNTNGIGKCGCSDENQYSLLTGQAVNSDVTCLLKEYRVESGANNTLYISN